MVSIGDDAAALAEKTFGILSVDNYPQPMGDASQYLDSTTALGWTWTERPTPWAAADLEVVTVGCRSKRWAGRDVGARKFL